MKVTSQNDFKYLKAKYIYLNEGRGKEQFMQEMHKENSDFKSKFHEIIRHANCSKLAITQEGYIYIEHDSIPSTYVVRNVKVSSGQMVSALVQVDFVTPDIQADIQAVIPKNPKILLMEEFQNIVGEVQQACAREERIRHVFGK